jgi:hypothetical protein
LENQGVSKLRIAVCILLWEKICIIGLLYIRVTVRRYRFLFNNQPDALFIQIYSAIKLHVSGIFFARHQEFSTLHSALVSFMQVVMTTFKQSGWNCSSILTLLGGGHHNLHEK